jgi:hypothetical protein
VNRADVAMTFFGFSLPAIFWFFARPTVLDSYKILRLEKSLDFFKRNKTLFNSLIEKQPTINTATIKDAIVLGGSNSNNSLVVVTSLTCPACYRAYEMIEGLLTREIDLEIKLIFANANHLANHQIISIASTFDQSLIKGAFTNWYEGRIEKLAQAANGIKADQDSVHNILKKHKKWCDEAGINYTPAILFNGRKVPEQYTFTDLERHISNLCQRPA